MSCLLILLLVKEKVILGRVIRPDIFYAFIDLAIIFKFLEVFNNLFGST